MGASVTRNGCGAGLVVGLKVTLIFLVGAFVTFLYLVGCSVGDGVMP